MKNNAVGWFEIPVNDMERAVGFYEKVLDLKMERHKMGLLDMAWFPWQEDGLISPGALVKHLDFYKPSTDGVLIYLIPYILLIYSIIINLPSWQKQSTSPSRKARNT